MIISVEDTYDAIAKYLNARYVSASEACWRLFNFGLQERSHKVERLPVHLQDKQTVFFQDNKNTLDILEKSNNTKLTEICEKNKNNLVISPLCYIDFPKHFI